MTAAAYIREVECNVLIALILEFEGEVTAGFEGAGKAEVEVDVEGADTDVRDDIAVGVAPGDGTEAEAALDSDNGPDILGADGGGLADRRENVADATERRARTRSRGYVAVTETIPAHAPAARRVAVLSCISCRVIHFFACSYLLDRQ